jgi:magnesium chelatase family protein
MKLKSFIRVGPDLVPAEIELNLMPGLPQILFLGLPDAAMRESAFRIRSALREQGFQLPQAHQVLVHLRPSHLRKTSQGLDLAVAAALLWVTGQLEKPKWLEQNPYFYGELSLKGEVLPPEDLADIDVDPTEMVITGPSGEVPTEHTLVVHKLKDLVAPELARSNAEPVEAHRPALEIESFPEGAARLLEVIAAGEHSALIAGAPGSGKSTLVEAVSPLLEAPVSRAFRTMRRLARTFGREVTWRPVVQPHHSITSLAMIGGGNIPWPGEITRAHGGVLIMDELLEFNPEIQDALREPLDSGQISIARSGNIRCFPASLLLLATTNLCPCGEFTPRRENTACRCTRAVRARSLQRLTGPFVDRFSIFSLTDEWSNLNGGHAVTSTVATQVIADRVGEAIHFRREIRGQLEPNGKINDAVIEDQLSDFQATHLIPDGLRSARRKSAILQVARTLADLRLSEAICNLDLEEAVALCWRTHHRIHSWRE